MKRVVVTGIGAVTPLGSSFAASWKAAKSGISGIGRIQRFDASGLKWKVAGELKDFDAGLYLAQNEIMHLDRFVHYAVGASLKAVEDAGLIQDSADSDSKLETRNSKLDNAGVIIGSSRGGIGTIEQAIVKRQNTESEIPKYKSQTLGFKLSPYLMPSTSINMAASHVARKLGIQGYCLGISNACSSGANAIGEAYRTIKSGYADIIIAGGSEAPICRLCIEGYGATGVLSRGTDSNSSRPFDRERDGFVLAEGASVLVLEDYEAALKRGARIYGEIIGYGNTMDAFHQTRPSPEGEARAITMALNEAGLSPRDIDYISAHGTSTPIGDKAETEAIKLALGRRAYEIPVSSVKSMTGHMLSASGAFEAAIALMGIAEGVITPTINLENNDPECDLNYVTETKNTEMRVAVSNSFGFGGVNVILVFRKV
ncbi:MAG: beta-ketoacyl-[acyl-carrier-protein] synthase II [Nitrospirae bacterium]|nr:beta-ketoacyl-[acyl-carrier-protein] synthase II [Nitrospirota bacterium]